MRREFPEHPLVGVGGVVVHEGRVLLIRRGREPLKGEWSIPGGMLELGEELKDGVRRELLEETGLEVEPLEHLITFERIAREAHPRDPDGEPRVRYHFVIIDYACRWLGGTLAPASDVVDARWVAREDLPRYHLTEMAAAVINRAFEYFRSPASKQDGTGPG